MLHSDILKKLIMEQPSSLPSGITIHPVPHAAPPSVPPVAQPQVFSYYISVVESVDIPLLLLLVINFFIIDICIGSGGFPLM